VKQAKLRQNRAIMPDILTVFFLILTMIVNKTFFLKISYTWNELLLLNKYNTILFRTKHFNNSLTNKHPTDNLPKNPVAEKN